MKSFFSLLIYLIIVYLAIGVGTVFTTYFMEYFFELNETEKRELVVLLGNRVKDPKNRGKTDINQL